MEHNKSAKYYLWKSDGVVEQLTIDDDRRLLDDAPILICDNDKWDIVINNDSWRMSDIHLIFSNVNEDVVIGTVTATDVHGVGRSEMINHVLDEIIQFPDWEAFRQSLCDVDYDSDDSHTLIRRLRFSW